MIPADVKANKTRNKRSCDCILQIFIRSIYLQNLKHKVKNFG